jgi:hypothetical protein
MLVFTENRRRSAGLSASANPRTILASVGLPNTTFGRSLLVLANEAALVTILEPYFLTDAQGDLVYQPLDADLTAIAALTTTTFGRSLLTLADEDALEALPDTLPNLTSIQGRTVTLADAGADAVFGWDDSESKYQNLAAADVRTAISVRTKLTVNTEYAVPGDFATIGDVFDHLEQNIDGGGFDVDIQLADATGYVVSEFLRSYVGIRKLTIKGNAANKRAVKLTPSTTFVFQSQEPHSTIYEIKDMELVYTGCDFGAVGVYQHGDVILRDLYWSGSGTSDTMLQTTVGNVVMFGTHTIEDTGTSNVLLASGDNAFLSVEPTTELAFIGTPTVAGAFQAYRNGVISMQSAVFTDGASVAGFTALLTSGGVVDVFQATGTLPGSAISNDGSGTFKTAAGAIIDGQRSVPVTETGTTHTVAETTSFLICNNTGTVTVTLPAVAANAGRSIFIKNIDGTATVVSASSNVAPIGSATAGTAILAATDGAWAQLVSDGTNWVIVAQAVS